MTPRAACRVFALTLLLSASALSAKDPVTGSYYLLFGALGGVEKLYPSGDPASQGRPLDAQVLNLKFVSSGYLSWATLDWAIGFEHVPLLKDALRSTRKSSSGVFGEVSPRLRIGSIGTYQVGPMAKISVGKDPSFAINGPAEQFFLAQVGPQFVYDIPFQKRYLARVELQTLMDINVPTRKIWSVVMGVQMGYLSESFTDRDFAQQRDDEEKKIYLDEKVSDVSRDKSLVKLTLRSELLRFSAGQSQLSPKAKAYLYKVAYFINTNPGFWKRLDIYGHTDSSPLERNQASLAKSRADAVRAALLEAGVAPYKIETFGKGSSEAKGNTADSSNRRVDLAFRGVSQEAFFEQELERIRLYKDQF
jgi:outer membrane protein OmpA-like peptidoglycan-associated protein